MLPIRENKQLEFRRKKSLLSALNPVDQVRTALLLCRKKAWFYFWTTVCGILFLGILEFGATLLRALECRPLYGTLSLSLSFPLYTYLDLVDYTRHAATNNLQFTHPVVCRCSCAIVSVCLFLSKGMP